MEDVISALKMLRIPLVTDEYQLQDLVAEALHKNGIEFVKEARLAPYCRVDFLCRGGVAVEVKRGKPSRKALLQQLSRYAESPQVTSLLLVVERTASLPDTVLGKPCRVLALNRLWGVAVG